MSRTSAAHMLRHRALEDSQPVERSDLQKLVCEGTHISLSIVGDQRTLAPQHSVAWE